MKSKTPKEGRLMEIASVRKCGHDCKKNKTGALKRSARRARRRHIHTVEVPRLVNEALMEDILVYSRPISTRPKKRKQIEVFTLLWDKNWPQNLLDVFFARHFSVNPETGQVQI